MKKPMERNHGKPVPPPTPLSAKDRILISLEAIQDEAEKLRTTLRETELRFESDGEEILNRIHEAVRDLRERTIHAPPEALKRGPLNDPHEVEGR